MKTLAPFIGVLLAATTGLAQQPGRTADQNSMPATFKITTRRAESVISVVQHRSGTVLDITSPFGIDLATIERRNPQWPRSIQLRLHLRGLESLRVSNEKITIQWSASAIEDTRTRVTLLAGKNETELSRCDPYWTEAKYVGSEKVDGYFEVQVPSKLFEQNPKQVTISWIDFYRN